MSEDIANPTFIEKGSFWRDARYAYTGDNLIYIGLHYSHKIPTTNAYWHIWKMTYSGTNVTRKEGPLIGSWDGKTSLDWA